MTQTFLQRPRKIYSSCIFSFIAVKIIAICPNKTQNWRFNYYVLNINLNQNVTYICSVKMYAFDFLQLTKTIDRIRYT